MNETYKHYSRDCCNILKQMARDAKRDADAARGTPDSDFRSGAAHSFYSVISLLRSQAFAFQIPLAELDLADIEPDKELLLFTGYPTRRGWRRRGSRLINSEL
jgi:hypothetical protein